MRVLHFYKTAHPDSMGGTQQVIHQIANGAVNYGVDTDVLSLVGGDLPEFEELENYRVHRARMNFEIASTGFSLEAFSLFYRLSRQADIVHYHFPWPFMDLLHFATWMKKPAIVSYHSDIIRQKALLKLYRPLMSSFLGDVDRIVAASPNYLATSDVLQKFSSKVNVIPYGLDQKTYPDPPQEKLEHWRGILGNKFFLFVGVLRYYKGLHVLLDAARELDYPIAILGAGPIEKELKAMAACFEMNNVHFLGHLPDVDKTALLRLCYSVVLPSHLRSEAFGISLLEGAMFGKPLISSEIGTGTTYVNIADETGLVVPPNDPVALREAMIYLWENPKMAQKYGCQAEQRYRALFSAEQMVKKYVQLYRQVISEASPCY